MEPSVWTFSMKFFCFVLHCTRRQLHQPFYSQPSCPDALLSRLGVPELADGLATCLHPSGPHCDRPESRFCLDLLAATFKGSTLSEVWLHGFLISIIYQYEEICLHWFPYFKSYSIIIWIYEQGEQTVFFNSAFLKKILRSPKDELSDSNCA